MEENGVKLQEQPQNSSAADTTEADRLRVLEEKKARQEAAAKIKKRKIRRKRILTALVLLVIIGGVAFGMYSLLHEEEAAMEPWAVAVSRGSISSMVQGSGQTRARQSQTMTLTSGGTVEEVFVTEGQFVHAGDPLYTVDSTDAQKAVEDARKRVEDYQEQIDAIYDSYADLTFTAPFSGKLLEAADIQVGDEISAGTALGTLVDDSTMKLSLYFSYAYESEFYTGRTATVSIPSTMQTVTGTVETINKVNRVSSEGSRLFEVVFSVPNSGTLTADMGATAYLTGTGGVEIYPYEPGTLAYSRSQELTTKAGGEVLSVDLLDYADVAAGQVLVQMSGEDNEDRLASLNTSLADAQKALKDAEDDLANYSAVAPFDGTILSCGLVAGETVGANFAAMTIADTSVIQVEAQVESMNVAYVQPGMPVTITAWTVSGETPYMGTVVSVSMEGNAENGMSTFPAIIEVDNADGSLRPNDYVDYSMVASESDNCLLVPVQAVKYAATGDTCLFVQADTAPENALTAEEVGMEVPAGYYAVPVTVGLSDQSNVEITSGVEEGQMVFVQYMSSEFNSWDMGGVSGGVVAVG